MTILLVISIILFFLTLVLAVRQKALIVEASQFSNRLEELQLSLEKAIEELDHSLVSWHLEKMEGTMTPQVEVLPKNTKFLVLNPKISVLEAAQASGISISTSCGGRLRCGQCKIYVEKGEEFLDPPSEAELEWIRSDLLERPEALRLACCLYPQGNLKISLPL